MLDIVTYQKCAAAEIIKTVMYNTCTQFALVNTY